MSECYWCGCLDEDHIEDDKGQCNNWSRFYKMQEEEKKKKL